MKLRLLIPLAVMLGVTAGAGCKATNLYLMNASDHVAKAVTNLETAAVEAQTATDARLTFEETQWWTEGTADLVEAAAIQDPAERAKAIATATETLRKGLAVVDTDRTLSKERTRRAAAWAAEAKITLARMVSLIQAQQATATKLEEYKVLAEQYVRQKFGLNEEVTP